MKRMVDLAGLSSPDWRQRRNALEGLADSDDQDLVERLLEILRQQHLDLGALNAALQVLGQMKRDVTPSLLQLMHEPDPQTRAYAILVLGELKDDSSQDALVEALRDADPVVRFNAVEALGKLRSASATPALLSLLREKDFYLAFPVLQALEQIGDPRALPEVSVLLEDELLGAAAAQTLGALGDLAVAGQLAGWLDTPGSEARAAVTALANLGRRYGLAQSPTVEKIPERQAVLTSLVGSLTRQGLDKIMATLPVILRSWQPDGKPAPQDTNFLNDLARLLGWVLEFSTLELEADRGAELAAQHAAQLAAPQLMDQLETLIGTGVAAYTAAEALIGCGTPYIFRLERWIEHPDGEVSRPVTQALGQSQQPVALEILERALDAENEELALLAAHAFEHKAQAPGGLAAMREKGVLEAIVSHLAHPSASVRQALIAALEKMYGPDLAERLPALLEDPDPLVREAGLRCLAFAPPPLAPVLAEDVLRAWRDPVLPLRLAAVDLLPAIQAEWSQPVLAQAVHDPQAQIRAAAARALGSIPTEAARVWLQEALRDPDGWTRRNACRALSNLGGAQAEAGLLDLIDDPFPPVRIALAEAFGYLGGAQARHALEHLKMDQEADVRLAAELALDNLIAGL